MLRSSEEPPRSSPEVRAALARLTVRRGRLLLLLGLAAVAVFGAINHLTLSPPPLWSDAMNGALTILIGLALLATRLAFVQRHMAPICLGLGLIGSAIRAWASVWHGEVASTAIFFVVMAVTAAAILPWGFWLQLLGASALAAMLAVSSRLVLGNLGPPPGHATAAVGLGLACSAILAGEMRRHYIRLFDDNFRRRDAEAALARLNAELERRVEQRTAELTAASRELAREAEERRQTEADLRESQRRLQAVLDHADVAVYLRDLDGRYLLANRYLLRMWGRRADEVIGHTMDELLPPDVAAVVRANDRAVLRASCSLQFEESFPLPDGWRTFITVKFLWAGRDGAPAGIWGLGTDITDRKQAEAELRRSEAALSAVIENTPDAIWSVDRDARVTVINGSARARFAQRYGATYGDDASAHVPAALREEFMALFRRALAGEHVQLERTEMAADGPRWELLSLHPIRARGEVIGATVFSKDVTDLKRAEQAARQHQADLAHVLRLSTMGEMASGLAHEINQPLGAIANYAQGCARRLRAGTADVATLLPIVEEIGGEALRAGEIIRRLRDLIRKDTARQSPADVNHLVRESVRLIEPEARARGVALHLDLTPDLPAVSCNDIQIEQVLLNLLLNGVEAVEAADNGERALAVRTALAGDAVQVAVADSGVGLPDPPADVFAPFYSTKSSGLGMGLSISRSIIEAHGGTLWGTRNPDRGSTFRFTLPA
ncbi:PAS domain-containing protein [bacterium]|nr:PAS domain-containing protein [bacterium]